MLCNQSHWEHVFHYISFWDIKFLAASSVEMVLSRLMFHTHGSDLFPGVRGFWSPNGSVGSNPSSDMSKFLAMGNVDTRLRLQVRSEGQVFEPQHCQAAPVRQSSETLRSLYPRGAVSWVTLCSGMWRKECHSTVMSKVNMAKILPSSSLEVCLQNRLELNIFLIINIMMYFRIGL